MLWKSLLTTPNGKNLKLVNIFKKGQLKLIALFIFLFWFCLYKNWFQIFPIKTAIPVLIIIPWTILKQNYENSECWTTNDNTYIFWFIRGPITLSIIVRKILKCFCTNSTVHHLQKHHFKLYSISLKLHANATRLSCI